MITLAKHETIFIYSAGRAAASLTDLAPSTENHEYIEDVMRRQ